MKTSLLTFSLVVTASLLHAETAPAAPFANPAVTSETTKSTPAASPVSSVSPATTLLPEVRRFSSETAARIGANAPKFSTAKIPAPNAKSLPDLRDIDKPKNRIIRLPREMVEKPVPVRSPLETSPDVLQLPAYIVRDRKVPDFKERELLTPEGKLDLAYKRHPGLRFGSLFFFSNDNKAREFLADDFERERIAEMKELGGLYQPTDAKSKNASSAPSNQDLQRSPSPSRRRSAE